MFQKRDLVFRLSEALPQPVQIVALYESPAERRGGGKKFQRLLTAMHDPDRLAFRLKRIPGSMTHLYAYVDLGQDQDEVVFDLCEILP
ncbi:hypothetical protein ACRE_081050 [Hapsidospora chrysogenum ATCC 11550]|uniref:Uncharacterized protein n=1 Tax=Hapsidospora chrysogenum (strain ATCC 11550 / CBS 779.69 / DSM 880 / IAM 14645 / JCM 23072 / IMI 49137) TaxID=857340 RepID=A0A086SVQ8_HAPC1|nr:hypothetical protein ACRE_081050 [Hapsidospora chrysogenum ATCC 11550]